MKKVKDFSEKQIRKQIITKLQPEISKGRKHDKALIYIESNEKCVARAKIPNDHTRIMRHPKSQYIAQSLHLKYQQFNDLIECPLTGPKYYELLEKIVK